VESAAGLLCFKQFTPGDLLINQAKIVGSAQRRQRGALLQHGAVLLARCPHAPGLPGILELTGRSLAPEQVCSAFLQPFTHKTGLALVPEQWSARERVRVEDLATGKYNLDAWNRKR